ncbi:MAG: TyeA family type III secretion system gatekeeper subunit [Candidatus Endonucleobacter bathymodioli]|uniref:TyeA family type III secretion system gatekeeper subunit n=1 Tax=Candidatus Endonucleibacter bathymodioli TaxID=539814 RepID=A0AA90NRW3_9GAMM|nr:TyeA family type III secretion system gatekeeper subunit [Candidatus Endonucleobacter bathymodioli]
MSGADHKDITAIYILNKIEADVNDGCFDKELYKNDIKQLKGQVSELSLLRTTLGQLKDHLPQYACDVEQIQDIIGSMECELTEMVDDEVTKTLRFNEGFNGLLGIITGKYQSLNDGKTWRDKKDNNGGFKNRDVVFASKSSVESEKDTSKDIKSKDILRKMLNLVEQQWVTETDFDQLPVKFGVKELSAKIFLMTKIVWLIRLMPEEMFNNEDTKQNMLASSQESLDGFIEEEAGEEVEGLLDVELGFGIVGEVTADLEFMSSSVGSGGLVKSASSEGGINSIPD